MGLTQGTPLQRTPEPIQRTYAEPTVCVLCLDRYQRERPSVCTCNHCSCPLCSDCMRDHVDEQPQSIAQLTQQWHELEEILQSKQNIVREEVTKSADEVKQYFSTYQNNLLEAHRAITIGLETSKQEAKEYLERVSLELQTIRRDIDTLAAETIFQPTRMEALLIQLNQLHEKLQTYQMKKDAELQIVLPKYSIKFQCIPPTTTDANEPSETESSTSRKNSARRPTRRNNYHPYKKTPVTVQNRNTSVQNGNTDHH